MDPLYGIRCNHIKNEYSSSLTNNRFTKLAFDGVKRSANFSRSNPKKSFHF